MKVCAGSAPCEASDLTTAGLGVALVVAQRFVTVDLLGGLALFGVVLALIGPGLAVVLRDDLAIKMRGAIIGTVSATLFLGDGLLLGERRLGRGLMRYLPYSDLDAARLSVSLAASGAALTTVAPEPRPVGADPFHLRGTPWPADRWNPT